MYSPLDTPGTGGQDIECEDDDPAPSAPPISSNIYPLLPENSSDMIITSPVGCVVTPVGCVVTPVHTTPTSIPLPTSQSDYNMKRVCVN